MAVALDLETIEAAGAEEGLESVSEVEEPFCELRSAAYNAFVQSLPAPSQLQKSVGRALRTDFVQENLAHFMGVQL
eukprot:SAG25_NODE_612_length_6550_cov_63.066026_6_plen_76_part_00